MQLYEIPAQTLASEILGGRDRKVEAWEIRGWEGYGILKILKGWEVGEIGQNYATMLSIYIW